MVPRGFPSNKWTFGQDFTVYEPMTDTYQYFKNFVSIMSIILEGSLMLESIRRSILRKYITKLHFSNKRWSIVHIGWQSNLQEWPKQKLPWKYKPPYFSSPLMMGSTSILGSMSGWKLIVGPMQVQLNPQYFFCRNCMEFRGGGAGGGEAGGHLPPHVLGIYLVNFGNFWKFIFRSLLSPPHKKFASAHPGGSICAYM